MIIFAQIREGRYVRAISVGTYVIGPFPPHWRIIDLPAEVGSVDVWCTGELLREPVRISQRRVCPKSVRTFEMMKQILKAGPNQMETLRRLRTDAAAIDKDVTVRSERIRQTRDLRIRFWFREKTMEQSFAASQHSDPTHSSASGDNTS